VNKASKTCQVCRYEERKKTWGSVVVCGKHAIRLCTVARPKRSACEPQLMKSDGTPVDDWKWLCEKDGLNCWQKFHKFYLPGKLFTAAVLNDDTRKKPDFANVRHGSDLYMAKCNALGLGQGKSKKRKSTATQSSNA